VKGGFTPLNLSLLIFNISNKIGFIEFVFRLQKFVCRGGSLGIHGGQVLHEAEQLLAWLG
jgi:hypothetical protein